VVGDGPGHEGGVRLAVCIAGLLRRQGYGFAVIERRLGFSRNTVRRAAAAPGSPAAGRRLLNDNRNVRS
jgi:hypothetical protein